MNGSSPRLMTETGTFSPIWWQATALVVACFLAHPASAVTISPDNPVPPYCLVRVQAVPGSTIWILGIQAGVLVNVDSQGMQRASWSLRALPEPTRCCASNPASACRRS